MQKNHPEISPGGIIILTIVLLNVIVLKYGFLSDPRWYNLAWVTIPGLLISFIMFHRKLS